MRLVVSVNDRDVRRVIVRRYAPLPDGAVRYSWRAEDGRRGFVRHRPGRGADALTALVMASVASTRLEKKP